MAKASQTCEGPLLKQPVVLLLWHEVRGVAVFIIKQQLSFLRPLSEWGDRFRQYAARMILRWSSGENTCLKCISSLSRTLWLERNPTAKSVKHFHVGKNNSFDVMRDLDGVNTSEQECLPGFDKVCSWITTKNIFDWLHVSVCGFICIQKHCRLAARAVRGIKWSALKEAHCGSVSSWKATKANVRENMRSCSLV